MQWYAGAGAACAAAGAALGLLSPRIIAAVPEPEPNPDEDPADYPEKVPYADLAARPRLAIGCAVACAVAGALLGVSLGWGWALLWLLPLVPVGCALAVIDYVTWYLPTRIIAPSYLGVVVLVAVASLVVWDWRVARDAVIGFAALGAYYGLMHLISPRMMARGDVRLAGLLGLALGPLGVAATFLSVVLAPIVMLVAIGPMMVLGHTIKRESGVLAGLGRRHLPYGPFLLVGALLAVVLAQALAV